MKKFKVNEIIYTIQGESVYAGFPCTIVRFCGCNLMCRYCDTPYALDEGEYFSEAEILEKAGQIGYGLVEFTGGEPLLQEDIAYLAGSLADKGYTVLIETNGTLDISGFHKDIIFVIDVKCPGSGEEKKFLYKNLVSLKPQDNLKFVLVDKNDYDWAKNFIRRNNLADHPNIIFSPVWNTFNLEELASLILRDRLNYVRLQVQLHKIIWGADRKGV